MSCELKMITKRDGLFDNIEDQYMDRKCGRDESISTNNNTLS